MNKKKNYYAYYLPHLGTSGVVRSWEECQSRIYGEKEAKYKKFSTHEESLEFIHSLLQGGAQNPAYSSKKKQSPLPYQDFQEPALFFDSGTGRKMGVEISVTDTQGTSQLSLLEDTPYLEHTLSDWGSYILTGDYTNNFGELLALHFALLIAEKTNILHIYGDSRLVIDYWSLGFLKKEKLSPHTVTLAHQVQIQRKNFEHRGGQIHHIHGNDNPADMGFHK